MESATPPQPRHSTSLISEGEQGMSTKTVGFRWQRWLPWAAGAAALLGFVLTLAPPGSAQAKKKDAKEPAAAKKKKKDDALDPAVLEKAITNRPADRDVSKYGGQDLV